MVHANVRRELEVIYASDGQVEHADLPELPIQYADYSAWQRRQLNGPLLEQLRHYWTEQLRDAPSGLELPFDLPPPAQPSGRGATHAFQVPEPVASGIRALAAKEGNHFIHGDNGRVSDLDSSLHGPNGSCGVQPDCQPGKAGS